MSSDSRLSLEFQGPWLHSTVLPHPYTSRVPLFLSLHGRRSLTPTQASQLPDAVRCPPMGMRAPFLRPHTLLTSPIHSADVAISCSLLLVQVGWEVRCGRAHQGVADGGDRGSLVGGNGPITPPCPVGTWAMGGDGVGF